MQRLTFKVGSELIGHLRGHEGVGDAVFLEVVVQCHQVEAHFFGDDVQLGTNGERAKQLLNGSIKAKTGVCGYTTLLRNVVAILMHVTESHHVTLLYLTTFGNSRCARSVNHGHQAVRLGANEFHGIGEARGDVFGQQHITFIELYKGKQGFIGDK